jgi:hypothetical protein
MRNKPLAFERKEDLTETDLQLASNVVQLHLLPGTKEPPSDFWLLNQQIGTIFLSRNKAEQRSFVLGEFAVYNIVPLDGITAYLLLVNEGEARPRPVWVDPKRFSNQMDLVGVVRTEAFPQVEDKEETKEISNDEDLRTV